jgi:uncharacterized protein (TIGR02594 family)
VTEPKWLVAARKHLGLAEIPGKEHHPTIQKWLKTLKAWWIDDETPWCGTFVAAVFREADILPAKHWYRAKGWLDWGIPIEGPKQGAVVVFERSGGGHVGFIVGVDQKGRLLVLGGNQGNKVSVVPFDTARVLGYRWPSEGALVARLAPPRVDSTAGASQNEA